MSTLMSTTRFHGAETSLAKYQESCLSGKLGVGLGGGARDQVSWRCVVSRQWHPNGIEPSPGCWCLWLRLRRGIAIAAVAGAVTTLLVGLVTNVCHSMRTLTTFDIHG